eukprot:975158-Rhodomonas_salina.7
MLCRVILHASTEAIRTIWENTTLPGLHRAMSGRHWATACPECHASIMMHSDALNGDASESLRRAYFCIIAYLKIMMTASHGVPYVKTAKACTSHVYREMSSYLEICLDD